MRQVYCTEHFINHTTFVFPKIFFLCTICRIHHTDDTFNPESVSLNSRTRISGNFNTTRSRRSMKEKLLMKDVAADIFDDPEIEDYGIEANYTVQSQDGEVMSRQFQSARREQVDRIELT